MNDLVIIPPRPQAPLQEREANKKRGAATTSRAPQSTIPQLNGQRAKKGSDGTLVICNDSTQFLGTVEFEIPK